MDQKKCDKKYEYYEIKVSVRDTHPPVWRRLRIPEGITFHELNAIIQISFGWSGYHAYDFEVRTTPHGIGILIELPELCEGWKGIEIRNSKEEKIDKYFKEYKKVKYTYDFGDEWIHDIIIEKIVETDIKLVSPVCIKAKMANLPEDCGGSYGYEDVLDILADKKNKRHEEMREWIGESCPSWQDDREYVDIEGINVDLEDYKDYAEFLLTNNE